MSNNQMLRLASGLKWNVCTINLKLVAFLELSIPNPWRPRDSQFGQKKKHVLPMLESYCRTFSPDPTDCTLASKRMSIPRHTGIYVLKNLVVSCFITVSHCYTHLPVHPHHNRERGGGGELKGGLLEGVYSRGGELNGGFTVRLVMKAFLQYSLCHKLLPVSNTTHFLKGRNKTFLKS